MEWARRENPVSVRSLTATANGTLPASFTTLTALTQLDLSRNWSKMKCHGARLYEEQLSSRVPVKAADVPFDVLRATRQ